MKTKIALLTAFLLAACQPDNAPEAPAAEPQPPSAVEEAPAATQPPPTNENASTAATDKMSPEEHERMEGETAHPADHASGKAASASGTVESVDKEAGEITIAHGAVKEVDWPAMTMAFKATPEQIASVRAGQKVDFQFEAKGMEATITSISPAK